MPLPARPLKETIYFIFILVVFSGCTDNRKTASKTPVKKVAPQQVVEVEDVQYTEKVLEAYLDSIGHLPVQPLIEDATREADSTFKNIIKPLNKVLSMAEFQALKKAVHAGMISAHIAKRIFPNLPVDTNCNVKSIFDSVKKGSLYLQYFPFSKDKNKFDEFAVRVGHEKHCSGSELYYFRGNNLIAEQDGYSKYNGDLSFLNTVDGQAIFYQVYEFTDGSGVWWNNYFFYKYDGDKLIPVLNELENGNLQDYMGRRAFWLESNIQKTNPLTIKMVYYVFLNKHIDNIDKDTSSSLINDSTIVRYKWDKKTKTLQAQFDQSKINRQQVLSYTLDSSDNLFIAAYYKLLKQNLNSKTQRPWVLAYLNKAKNNYNRQNKHK